jgi:hypothetical protein
VLQRVKYQPCLPVAWATPRAQTGVTTPPSGVHNEILVPDFVLAEVVLHPSVDAHVLGDKVVCAAVVVVNAREQVAEVAVARGSVHDEVP